MNLSKDYNGIMFRISADFECVIHFDELIKKASFCFDTKSKKHPHTNPILFFNKPILDGDNIKINCLEISYKNDGVFINGVSYRTELYSLNDITKNPSEMIKSFLIKDGADDLIIDSFGYKFEDYENDSNFRNNNPNSFKVEEYISTLDDSQQKALFSINSGLD